MTKEALDGKPYAGNRHVRFDEGDGASAKPRRLSLLYTKLFVVLSCVGWIYVSANTVQANENDPKVIKRYYLNPLANENSAANGTKELPFTKLEDAKQAVRKAIRDRGLPKGIVEVVVADGEYSLAKAVEFDNADSGTDEHPVRWRSRTRCGVRISGAMKAPPFKKLTDREVMNALPPSSRGKVVVFDLAALSLSDDEWDGMGWGKNTVQSWRMIEGGVYRVQMELICDDEPQVLARWPNEGFTSIEPSQWTGKHYEKKPRDNRFGYADARISKWNGEAAPRANGFFFHDWRANDIVIASVEPSLRCIVAGKPGASYGFSDEGYWYGYNLLCELDSPGEYYLDRCGRRLYYIPRDGKTDHGYRLTRAVNLLRVSRDLANVTFAGFVFENCRGNAVEAHSMHGVTFLSCVFRNVGGAAMMCCDTWRTRVVGCDVYNCGAGGVLFSGGRLDRLKLSNSVVRNCHIHHYATKELSYAPAIAMNGCGFSAENNTIHDGPHWAIKLDGPENLIISNEIHSVCLDCGEMGAVYSYASWLRGGSIIGGNYIHDIYNPRWERNRAVMLDGGCAGVSIVSNMIERVAQGVSLSDIGNRVEGNVFVDCKPPISAWNAWHDPKHIERFHPGLLSQFVKTPVRDEPWKSRHPYLSLLLDAIEKKQNRPSQTRSTIKHNMTSESHLALFCRWAPYSVDSWDVEGNRTRMRKEELAKSFEKVKAGAGVYQSPERASWPVRSPVTIKSTRLVDKKRGPDECGRFVPAKGL